jgi:ubiquinone/menaquinone biosynthesis C-methylase UbiE
MDERNILDDIELAAQLRQPQGESGIEVAAELYSANKHFIHTVIDVLQIEDNDNILEVGPGSALHVKYLFEKSQNIHYTAVDISETMVEMAKRVNDDLIKQDKAEFFLGSSDSLPFDDNSFDKIFTVNTIYFFDEIEAHLKEIRRVLKPEGKVCIGFMSKDYMRTLPFTNTGFIMYNPGDAIRMFEENGFKMGKSLNWKEKNFIPGSGHITEKEYIILSARK